MKKILVILAMLVAINANAQWVQQYSDTITNIMDVDFVSPNTGWAVGYKYILPGTINEGRLFKTTNGGNTWTLQNLGAISGFFGVDFIDQNTGWITGSNKLIMKTTNGGAGWIMQLLDTLDFVEGYKVKFINSNTGWVTGTYIYKTVNGGLNWNRYSNTLNTTKQVYFINDNTGFLTTFYTKIFKTTNTGNNWSEVYSGMSQSFVYDISFVNDNTGWAVGGDSVWKDRGISGNNLITDGVLKTTNGGNNWISINNIPGMRSLYFKDLNTGWIGGNGGIKKTTNGGLTWVAQSLPNNIYQITRIRNFFDTTLYAVGILGSIYKTTNGGVGIINLSTETPSKYSLSQNYPNPFNPTTNIKFSIVNTGEVKLVVYDIQGREVRTLVNESLKPGTYEAAFDGSALNTGVYFYKLITSTFSETKKMLMIK